MTGFRVALGGAGVQSVYARPDPGFAPDMSVFGKVIGGGMPLARVRRQARGDGASSRRSGPVYQAGTLSGQPGRHRLRPGDAARDPAPRLLRRPVGARARSSTACSASARAGRRADGGRQRRRHVRLLLRRRCRQNYGAVMALTEGWGHQQPAPARPGAGPNAGPAYPRPHGPRAAGPPRAGGGCNGTDGRMLGLDPRVHAKEWTALNLHGWVGKTS